MGWIRCFIAVITCRSCKTTDEKALKERNKLRQKLGKNKIVPLASTDLDIRIDGEEVSTRANPTTGTVDVKGEQLTPEGKWAAPRTPSRGSIRNTAGDDNDQRTPEGKWATSSKESASTDSSLAEFALNYVKTEVLPGAIARFLVEQKEETITASVSGESTGISESVSDLVQASLTNAERLLRQEQGSKMSVSEKILRDDDKKN